MTRSVDTRDTCREVAEILGIPYKDVIYQKEGRFNRDFPSQTHSIYIRDEESPEGLRKLWSGRDTHPNTLEEAVKEARALLEERPFKTTPLHTEADSTTLRALITAGNSVNARDGNGATPLHHQKSPEAVRLLIKAGAHADAKDRFGRTPLHEQESPAIIRLLIEAGADVNAKDRDGNSPLHFRSTAEAVRTLMDAGADIHAKNKIGSTPWKTSSGSASELLKEVLASEQRHIDLGKQWDRHAPSPAPARTSKARGRDRW